MSIELQPLFGEVVAPDEGWVFSLDGERLQLNREGHSRDLDVVDTDLVPGASAADIVGEPSKIEIRTVGNAGYQTVGHRTGHDRPRPRGSHIGSSRGRRLQRADSGPG